MSQQNGQYFQVVLFWIQKIQKTADKRLELIREVSKFTRYTFKIPKRIVFLYISHKQKKSIFLKMPFIVASKKLKYLGISLTKEV